MGVTGGAVIYGDLGVTGGATVGSLYSNGGIAGASLGITGNAVVQGKLTVGTNGGSNDLLYVDTDAIINGDVGIGTNLNVNGNLTVGNQPPGVGGTINCDTIKVNSNVIWDTAGVKLGIGLGLPTTGPAYPLHIHGGTTSAYQAWTHTGNVFDPNNLTLETSGYLGGGKLPFSPFTPLGTSYPEVSAYFEEGVLMRVIRIFSDRRIKDDIRLKDTSESLEIMKKISCYNYKYKDPIKNGNKETMGFIAQEVDEHFSVAVEKSKNFIPNELRKLNATWNGTKMISDLTNVDGIKYRFYVSNDINGNDEVSREIIGNPDNTFTFDASYNNIFCWGKEVDDFHTLNKQKLFALNFSATQEIDKIQQEEKTKLEAAGAKITTLEAENIQLRDRLSAIETRLVALEAK